MSVVPCLVCCRCIILGCQKGTTNTNLPRTDGWTVTRYIYCFKKTSSSVMAIIEEENRWSYERKMERSFAPFSLCLSLFVFLRCGISWVWISAPKLWKHSWRHIHIIETRFYRTLACCLQLIRNSVTYIRLYQTQMWLSNLYHCQSTIL